MRNALWSRSWPLQGPEVRAGLRLMPPGSALKPRFLSEKERQCPEQVMPTFREAFEDSSRVYEQIPG